MQTKQQQIVIKDVTAAICMLVHGQNLIIDDYLTGIKVYRIQSDSSLHFATKFFEDLFPNAVIVDHEGNLWVATFGNGLYFLPATNVVFRNLSTALPPESRRLTTVYAQKDRLIVGSDNGTVSSLSWDTDAAQSTLLYHDVSAQGFGRTHDIAEDPEGNLYFAGDNGFIRQKGGQFQRLYHSSVKGMTQDANGNFLFATSYGVARANYQRLQREPIKEGRASPPPPPFLDIINRNRSYAALLDQQGNVWMDDMVNGLQQLNADGQTISWAVKDRIFYAQAKDIISWHDSLSVIATQGEGIILIKGEDYWSINAADGLPSDLCKTLLVEKDVLWIGTNKGLAAISQLNWTDRSFNIDVINRTYGLFTDDIEDMALVDDQLALATYQGLLLLDKGQQIASGPPPHVYLTELKVNNKHFGTETPLNLKHKDNNIRFHFLGLSYKSLGEVRYRYRLTGLEKDWTYTRSREVNYADLRPGDYTFELFAISKSGQESEVPLQYTFSIKPALYQRPIFTLLIGILVIALAAGGGYIYRAIRQRESLKKLVAEKTNKLNEQVEELAQTNARLERSNNELEQFARVASHDLKSPLRNVASFVQLLERRAKTKLNEEEREFIQLAVEGTRSMERVINDLLKMSQIDQEDVQREVLNFQTIAKQVFKEHKVLVAEQQAQLIFDTALPDIFFSAINAKQLLQNLIVNGITYNRKGQADIHLGCQFHADYLQFYVKDNGIGIAAEYHEQVFTLFKRLHTAGEFPGTGIGLAICKKIVECNGGRIWFDSEEHHGTTFYFTLARSKVDVPEQEAAVDLGELITSAEEHK